MTTAEALRGMKLCSFEGCGRPSCARGLCGGHWKQWRKGVPLRALTVTGTGPLPSEWLPDGCLAIRLGNGPVATVSAEDADLAEFRWTAHLGCTGQLTPYAVRTVWQNKRNKMIEMHRVIAERMGIAGQADHRNRNGLDNRRSNLRPATHSQNQANRALLKNNTSGYKGVKRRKDKWQADIMVMGRRTYLGTFADITDAARAYDAAALAAWGEFAYLNFPPDAIETAITGKAR